MKTEQLGNWSKQKDGDVLNSACRRMKEWVDKKFNVYMLYNEIKNMILATGRERERAFKTR